MIACVSGTTTFSKRILNAYNALLGDDDDCAEYDTSPVERRLPDTDEGLMIRNLDFREALKKERARVLEAKQAADQLKAAQKARQEAKNERLRAKREAREQVRAEGIARAKAEAEAEEACVRAGLDARKQRIAASFERAESNPLLDFRLPLIAQSYWRSDSRRLATSLYVCTPRPRCSGISRPRLQRSQPGIIM